jgi:serine/threonine-protein kinase
VGAAVDALGLVGTTVEAVVFDACVDSGGFGLVYRGRHTGLDEPVAIKCLRVAGLNSSDADIREAIAGRFRDETKLLYRLSQGHLDIVRCIGSGTLVAPRTNELTPYMILEWLEGQTLSAELRDRREESLPGRSLEEAIALLDTAASALAYAHAQGIVHRDIKPGNLFLAKTREGVRMKVLDFGLAKILSDESLGVRPSVETGAGVHFCSPSYGAPEQLTGKAGPVGPWTDIYSLTLVMLEVMKGDKVRPAGSLAEGLLKALDPKTGSPSASSLGLSVPPAVEDLLLRAVSLKPLERPRDAGAFWTALKEALRTSLPSQKSAPAPAPAAPQGNFAATVADANVEAAMERVRQIQAARAKTPQFAGTMLMSTAPQGAPHLAGATPLPAAGTPPPAPAPAPEIKVAAGPAPSPLAASIVQAPSQPPPQPKQQQPGTIPMAAPMQQPNRLPSNRGMPAVVPPMSAGPMSPPPMNPPMQPMPAPMNPMNAPQMVATRPAPLARPPTGGAHPITGSGHSSVGPPMMSARAPQSVPPPMSARPAGVPKKGGGGLMAVFVFFIVLAAGGFAGWWFYFRHHH